MKLRRFVASDMRAALALIKAELGADAVIMSNKRTEDGIEIVAGYEERNSATSLNSQASSKSASGKAASLSGYIDDELTDDEVSIGGPASSRSTASKSAVSARSPKNSSATVSTADEINRKARALASSSSSAGKSPTSRASQTSESSARSSSVNALAGDHAGTSTSLNAGNTTGTLGSAPGASAASSSLISSKDKAESFAKSLMEILERQQRSGALPNSRSAGSVSGDSTRNATASSNSSRNSTRNSSGRRTPPAPLSQQSGTGDFIRDTEEAQRKAAQKTASKKAPDFEREHGISSYDEGDKHSSSGSSTVSSAELDRMRDEIAGLRKLLQFELAGLMRDSDARSQPVRAMLTSVLSSSGLEPKLASDLCNKIDADASVNFAWRELSKLLTAKLKTGSDEILREGGVVALVGPAGVGKTTSLAKLAARFVIAYGADKIALVTCDHYRIGATEQLKTYARIMGCESYAVKSPAELPKLLLSLKDKSLVLVDTAGVGLHDSRFETQLTELKSQKRLSIKHYLVLPATARRRVLEEAYAHFESLGLKGLILTRLDECGSLMDALSLCLTREITLSYTTDGQKVPEDLEVPSARGVVQQALMTLENETAVSAVRDFQD